MKRTKYIAIAIIAICMATVSCKDKSAEQTAAPSDSLETVDPDTTVYGICGEGTTMHSLELITEEGDTVTYLVDEDEDDRPVVKGGLLAGDKMAVIGRMVDGELSATQVVNMTTLEGKWTSLDRNFEIVNGGEVLSTIQSESNPYTSWKIHNGQLLMGRDSFDVLTLGADTLELENKNGIFVYTRK